ncbi:hypothetical protein C8F01DRAFT_1284819 [Mycena amicta]|nr:hypothetical protein C8F01DRAFT_1284819 [Mycena amicta]
MAYSQVPEELLLEVCKNLHIKDLGSISCANHTLRRISRPLIFEDLVFQPYESWSYHGAGSTWDHSPDKKLRLLLRLEFYLSEATASLVRSCSIRPAHPTDSSRAASVNSDKSGNPVYSLLNRLLDEIPSFTSLRTLDISVMVISNHGLAQILHLHQLKKLTMRLQTVDIRGSVDIPTPGLQLSELSVELDSDGDTDSGVSMSLQQYWKALMNPLSLHTVTLTSSLSWWAQSPSDVPIFPRVERLTIIGDEFNWRQPLHPNFALNLEKFPAIHDLGVCAGHDHDTLLLPDALSSILVAGLHHVLPRLKRIRGACNAPRMFISVAPALTHIEMTNFLDSDILVEYLPTSETLITVCLNLTDMRIESLEGILRRFPCLEELRVNGTVLMHQFDSEALRDYSVVRTNSNGALELLPSLTYSQTSAFWKGLSAGPILPASMKTIAIVGKSWTRVVPTALRVDVEALRDAFVARFPELVFLKLKGDGFFLRYERHPGSSRFEGKIVVDSGL